jgi:hypothetical protein
MIKQEENNGIWKVMIVGSFLMLSMLTWGMSPLQKLVEKVQHKETIKAKLLVCSEIRASMSIYQDWLEKLWVSGCMWETRNIYVTLQPEKEKDIEAQIKAQEGLEFDKFLNHCSKPAAEAIKDNKVTEKVATPLYFEKLDCPAVYEEAKKLGIDDVQ